MLCFPLLFYSVVCRRTAPKPRNVHVQKHCFMAVFVTNFPSGSDDNMIFVADCKFVTLKNEANALVLVIDTILPTLSSLLYRTF